MELGQVFSWVNGVEESHRYLKWSVQSMREGADKDKTNGFQWHWAGGPVEGGDYKFVMVVICMVVTWLMNGRIQMARLI